MRSISDHDTTLKGGSYPCGSSVFERTNGCIGSLTSRASISSPKYLCPLFKQPSLPCSLVKVAENGRRQGRSAKRKDDGRLGAELLWNVSQVSGINGQWYAYHAAAWTGGVCACLNLLNCASRHASRWVVTLAMEPRRPPDAFSQYCNKLWRTLLTWPQEFIRYYKAIIDLLLHPRGVSLLCRPKIFHRRHPLVSQIIPRLYLFLYYAPYNSLPSSLPFAPFQP